MWTHKVPTVKGCGHKNAMTYGEWMCWCSECGQTWKWIDAKGWWPLALQEASYGERNYGGGFLVKRSGPLKRKTSLGGGGGLKRTKIKPRSKKREKLMAEDRRPYIQSLVDAGFGCEVGPVLAEYGIDGYQNCNGQIQGLHERRKRGQGGSLVNRDNLVPACIPCNGWIEDRYPLLREDEKTVLGNLLVVHDGDPEWESLGKKAD